MWFSVRRGWSIVAPLTVLIALAGFTNTARSQNAPQTTPSQQSLNSLSLEELASLEVTTLSKEPEQIWDTPAAIYVITNDEIRRSGVTNIPDALRLAPGVEV